MFTAIGNIFSRFTSFVFESPSTQRHRLTVRRTAIYGAAAFSGYQYGVTRLHHYVLTGAISLVSPVAGFLYSFGRERVAEVANHVAQGAFRNAVPTIFSGLQDWAFSVFFF